MNVSYIKLWKLLLDKGMKRVELKETAGISSSTLAKLEKMSLYLWRAWQRFVWHCIAILVM